MASRTFAEVAQLLDEPTRRLFISMVEYHLENQDEGCEFHVIQTAGGVRLLTTGVRGTVDTSTLTMTRVRELMDLNLLRRSGSSRNGGVRVEIPAQSVRFYRHLLAMIGEPIDLVQKSAKQGLMDGAAFARRHPRAVQHLRKAVDLLATDHDLTTAAKEIGNDLRSALLGVATSILDGYDGSPEDSIAELVRRHSGSHVHVDPATAKLAEYASEVLRQAQRLTHIDDETHKDRALTGWSELRRAVFLTTVACQELAELRPS